MSVSDAMRLKRNTQRGFIPLLVALVLVPTFIGTMLLVIKKHTTLRTQTAVSIQPAVSPVNVTPLSAAPLMHSPSSPPFDTSPKETVSGCFYKTASCPLDTTRNPDVSQCGVPIKVCGQGRRNYTCKAGVNEYVVNERCGDTDTFRGATFMCYDGFLGYVGDGARCESSEYWKLEANNACRGHSSCLALQDDWVQCVPRPACLDMAPPCQLSEPARGWC